MPLHSFPLHPTVDDLSYREKATIAHMLIAYSIHFSLQPLVIQGQELTGWACLQSIHRVTNYYLIPPYYSSAVSLAIFLLHAWHTRTPLSNFTWYRDQAVTAYKVLRCFLERLQQKGLGPLSLQGE